MVIKNEDFIVQLQCTWDWCLKNSLYTTAFNIVNWFPNKILLECQRWNVMVCRYVQHHYDKMTRFVESVTEIIVAVCIGQWNGTCVAFFWVCSSSAANAMAMNWREQHMRRRRRHSWRKSNAGRSIRFGFCLHYSTTVDIVVVVKNDVQRSLMKLQPVSLSPPPRNVARDCIAVALSVPGQCDARTRRRHSQRFRESERVDAVSSAQSNWEYFFFLFAGKLISVWLKEMIFDRTELRVSPTRAIINLRFLITI